MIKWSTTVLPHRAIRRAKIRYLALGLVIGAAISLYAQSHAGQECNEAEIIKEHYTEILNDIHGAYFDPRLTVPERKPR
jgi:hypothetical protein